MTICWLVRSALTETTETGSWRGVERDLESCHRLQKVYIFFFSYVLLVVLCHTTFEHIGLFVPTRDTANLDRALALAAACPATHNMDVFSRFSAY